MKDLLKDYTKYNIWANERICRVLEPLGAEILDREFKSSYTTIRKTVYHIWDSEFIWIKRLSGKSLKEGPSTAFNGTFLEFQNDFLAGSGKFFMYVLNKEGKDLEKDLSYKNIKGDPFKNKIHHIIQHVVNHSTFHRGQIITLLRTAGITELPTTDFIAFVRENK
jgi:uncharacterized damage-inducible protein DinB